MEILNLRKVDELERHIFIEPGTIYWGKGKRWTKHAESLMEGVIFW
jgi:hypothetical protein